MLPVAFGGAHPHLQLVASSNIAQQPPPSLVWTLHQQRHAHTWTGNAMGHHAPAQWQWQQHSPLASSPSLAPPTAALFACASANKQHQQDLQLQQQNAAGTATMLPAGFWRLLADSPPQLSPCALSSLPVLLPSPSPPRQFIKSSPSSDTGNTPHPHAATVSPFAVSQSRAISNVEEARNNGEGREEDHGGRRTEAEGKQLYLHHTLSPTPPARQNTEEEEDIMVICRRSVRLTPIAREGEAAPGVADLFGKMPELEREEESGPSSGGESSDEDGKECENVPPPQLDAEGDCPSSVEDDELVPPPLLAPLRFLEIAAAMQRHEANNSNNDVDGEEVAPKDSDVSPAIASAHCLPSSSLSSLSTSSCSSSSTSGISSADSTTSLLLEANEETPVCENKEVKGRWSRKRKRRRAPKLGLRRKKRQATATTMVQTRSSGEERGPTEEEQLEPMQLEENKPQPPPEESVYPPPKKRRRTLGTAEDREYGQRRKLAKLISNWRPVGDGIVRRPYPESGEKHLCYEAIRHRTVPGVVIRPGDCVQVNSADSEDDIFVGQVLAIHFEEELHALQLTLLWFYTPRQLPVELPETSLHPRELFASRHLDAVNVDSVNALAHVLSFAEYCRFRAESAALGRLPVQRRPPDTALVCPRSSPLYPRRESLPRSDAPLDTVFFCRGVFSLSRKRVKSFAGLQAKRSAAGKGLRLCRRI